MNPTPDPAAPTELKVKPYWVVAIWTLYAAIFISQAMLNRPPTMPAPYKPWGFYLYWLGNAWTWAALTPLIALLIRRARPSFTRPWTLLLHLAVIAIIHGLLITIDSYTFYFVAKRFGPTVTEAFRRGFALTVLLYSAAGLAVLALDHARLARTRAARAAQLEADLTRARLDTLRRQIQPHFLFNTLNTIAELIDTDPARAGTMVAGLGQLLRRSLQDQEHSLVPLHAELELVRLYTDIEQVRFESWLAVVLDIENAAEPALVPPMILQPLVENAIKHGIAPLRRKGTITVSARVIGSRLQLEVSDDGVGMRAAGSRAGNGIGLNTARERLTHLFGDQATLAVQSQPDAGTRVTLQLPFSTQPD